jgi:hypothetical protein
MLGAVGGGSGLGERLDQIRGLSGVNGARATWVIKQLTEPLYFQGAHVNQTLWVGANGRNPQVTWVEVGDLAGSQNGDLVDNWTYYTSRGINCPPVHACGGVVGGSYSALNLGLMGAPVLNTVHTFAAFYSGTSFQVNVDGKAEHYWPLVHGPTIEYDVGYEATCAGGCSGGSPDSVDPTLVHRIQYHRAHDGAWINTDRGTLRSLGAGGNGGIGWCTWPLVLRDWLNTSADPNICG